MGGANDDASNFLLVNIHAFVQVVDHPVVRWECFDKSHWVFLVHVSFISRVMSVHILQELYQIIDAVKRFFLNDRHILQEVFDGIEALDRFSASFWVMLQDGQWDLKLELFAQFIPHLLIAYDYVSLLCLKIVFFVYITTSASCRNSIAVNINGIPRRSRRCWRRPVDVFVICRRRSRLLSRRWIGIKVR